MAMSAILRFMYFLPIMEVPGSNEGRRGHSLLSDQKILLSNKIIKMCVFNGQNNISTLYVLSADRREHVSSTLQGVTQTLATFHIVTCYGSIGSCCFFGLSSYESQVSFLTFYYLALKADSSVCFSHYIFTVSTISLQFTS